MKRDILNEEVDQIINQSFWGKGGIKITESSEQQVTDQDVDEEGELIAEEQDHTCPLCESKIEQPISDDQLAEHINLFLDIINQVDDISDEEINAIKEAIDEELDDDSEDDDEDDSDSDDEEDSQG